MLRSATSSTRLTSSNRIFATPSIILTSGGSIGMALVLWLLGAIVASAGTAVYLELGTVCSAPPTLSARTSAYAQPGWLSVYMTPLSISRLIQDLCLPLPWLSSYVLAVYLRKSTDEVFHSPDIDIYTLSIFTPSQAPHRRRGHPPPPRRHMLYCAYSTKL